MKKIIFGLSVLCIMACGSPSTKTESTAASDFVVSPRQIGKAKIGMKKADFWKAYPNAKDGVIMIEGEIPSWDVPDTDGKNLFHATYDSDTVMFLITENPKFQTAEGIKIGDTYEKLKQIYPDVKINFAEGYLANVPSKHYSFFIEGEIEGDIDDVGNFTPKKIAKDVKVRDISTQ